MYRFGLVTLLSLALPAVAESVSSKDSFSAVNTEKWINARHEADSVISKMTLKEKSLMVTGTFDGTCIEYIAPIKRLGFGGLCIQDGPIGLRLGDLVSVFPSGVTTAATWDRQLMGLRGEAMADEFKAKGAHVILGPVAGALGRTPYGGRNWEGFSPDPYLTGIAMDETIRAIQQRGVQATAKHLVGNEQETQRKPTMINGKMVDAVSSNIDDRTMHELYLWPFADAVHAGVASVMCGYNRINETYSCENKHLINNLLKKELGFEGYVMSDFLATPPGFGSVKAGLDMNQPGPVSLLPLVESYWGGNLVDAVKNETLLESDLDGMVRRILTPYFYLGQDKQYPSVDPSSQPLVYNGFKYPYPGPSPVGRDVRGNHSAIIREIAAAGTVLLKNEGSILPLNKSLTNIGLFGNDAADPSVGTLFSDHDGVDIGTLISGGGSGSGRPSYVVSPLDAFKVYAKENNKRLQYVTNNTAILGTMPGLYPWPEVCIVFLKSFATEGFDRKTLVADDNSVGVVNSVASRCPRRTVVVTHSGGPDIMPWATNPNVSAIVAAHYPGQESGNSIMDVLTGDVNPSGKLPYTIAKKEDDYNTGITNITGTQAEDASAWQSDFEEGLFIDYRHFDNKELEPLYEFGFGLSYTTFSLSSVLAVSSAKTIAARAPASNATIALGGHPSLWETVAQCSVEVSNTGRVAGATVVQLYVSLPQKNIPAGSPLQVLRGFEKLHLEPGESKKISFSLKRRDLSYWDVSAQDWVVPKGDIKLSAGFSSRDLKASTSVVLVK
ncbi:beta-glucosidase g [Fusarium longipes]|uniref:Beta-glucosidase cel3A n=1 Tax=Fusarium longipes TaxID=694270 RepID=A0A395T2G7_9HYPO|nr:beta-glucosidase g [Fusarium longipes]